MKRDFVKLYCLLILVAFAGCGRTASENSNSVNQKAGEITVSAAISLKDAFDEIGAAYQAKNGTRINFNYGASGALQQQIEAGAPVDVFASAGEKQMDDLAKNNLIDAASRKDFAGNSLVLIVPNDSRLEIKAFEDLTKTEVKKIAAGNPKTVPAGQYAEESLANMNLQNVVQPKLIFAENVRQVLDYVVRGETDAGIVYATDVQAAKDSVKIAATANESSHAPILYPLAIVANSKQKAAAQAFADFVLSAEGQDILRRYGFQSASAASAK